MLELTNAEFIVSASRLKRHVLECNWLQRKVSRILFQPVAPTSCELQQVRQQQHPIRSE